MTARMFMELRFGGNFGHMPSLNGMHIGNPPSPARLAVGAPHDLFEQEADTVADQVTRMPLSLTASQYDFSEVRDPQR